MVTHSGHKRVTCQRVLSDGIASLVAQNRTLKRMAKYIAMVLI